MTAELLHLLAAFVSGAWRHDSESPLTSSTARRIVPAFGSPAVFEGTRRPASLTFPEGSGKNR